VDVIGAKKLEEHVKGHKTKPSEDSGYQSTRKVTPPQEENEAMKIVEENAEEQEDSTSSSGSGKQSVATPPSTPTPPSPAEAIRELDSKQHRPVCVSDDGPPSDPLARQKGIITWAPDSADQWTPFWVEDPDLELIKEMISPYVHLCGLSGSNITVKFLAEGVWNKVYTVSCLDRVTGTEQQCILRLPLPVDPWYKVQTEVATMEYVRLRTSIPVPKVYAFDSSSNNKLRLEWILMEKISGKTYDEVDDSLDFAAHKRLHLTVADWVDQLARLTFDQIGSLYCRWDQPSPDYSDFHLGPVSYSAFFPDFRPQYKVFRGPFETLAEFYRAIIRVNLLEVLDEHQKNRTLYWKSQHESSEDENKPKQAEAEGRELSQQHSANTGSNEIDHNDELTGDNQCKGIEMVESVHEEEDEPMVSLYSEEDLKEIPKFCARLEDTIDLIKSKELSGQARTFLEHWDISYENIMVDDAGNPLALIDWEQIVAGPFALATKYPPLIEEWELIEPPAWPADKPKTATQREWERRKMCALLRQAFDARLEELGSPSLRKGERDEDMDNLWAHVMNLKNFRNETDWIEEVRTRKQWRR